MLASLLGTILALISIFLLFFLLLVVSLASGGKEEVKVKASSVLHLTCDAMLLERGNDNENSLASAFGNDGPGMALDHFIADIQRASTDSHI